MITIIHIKGMHCPSCKKLLEEVISEVKGVNGVEVDFKSGKAIINHEGKLNIKAVKKEIDSLGLYEVIIK